MKNSHIILTDSDIQEEALLWKASIGYEDNTDRWKAILEHQTAGPSKPI